MTQESVDSGPAAPGVCFRAEAERAGLKPHTVDTYVGRCEQFVRWLAGGLTFRGPNEVDRRPRGAAIIASHWNDILWIRS